MPNYEILNIDCKEFEMECVHFGNGKKPFVIIPGVSMNPVVLSAPAIASAYNVFCDDYDVYLFDRRKNMPLNYSVFQMAEDTAIAMEKLNINNAYIFGTSQGGIIAQYLAINHSQLVEKLVLGSTMSRMNDTAKSTFDLWVKLAEEKNYKEINRNMFFNMFSDGFIEQYKNSLPVIEENGSEKNCERFEIQVKALYEVNTYDDLHKIKCPVLVIGAELDSVLSCEASVEIAEKIVCELYIYNGYRHAVYDEASDYKQRILKFLA